MKPNRKLNTRTQDAAELALCHALLRLRTAPQVQSFLKDLCTPAELQALVDRWQVVELLNEGHPYRRIHDITGVSVTTIGRVARFLTGGFGGYRRALGKRN